jgi:hypothetical protein
MYSDEFKKCALKVYPDFSDLHTMIENGNIFAGYLIKDDLEVPVIIRVQNISDLQMIARKQELILESKLLLYAMWKKEKIVNQHFKNAINN